MMRTRGIEPRTTAWKAAILKEFQTAGPPFPNWRLPESSIKYDARLGNFDFINNPKKARNWDEAISIGTYLNSPWNNLIKRPIPQWKNYGLKRYENDINFPFLSTGDTKFSNIHKKNAGHWKEPGSEPGKKGNWATGCSISAAQPGSQTQPGKL